MMLLLLDDTLTVFSANTPLNMFKGTVVSGEEGRNSKKSRPEGRCHQSCTPEAFEGGSPKQMTKFNVYHREWEKRQDV